MNYINYKKVVNFYGIIIYSEVFEKYMIGGRKIIWF